MQKYNHSILQRLNHLQLTMRHHTTLLPADGPGGTAKVRAGRIVGVKVGGGSSLDRRISSRAAVLGSVSGQPRMLVFSDDPTSQAPARYAADMRTCSRS
jgi:hypothetical protein